MTGSLVAGFVLIPRLGMQATAPVAVAFVVLAVACLGFGVGAPRRVLVPSLLAGGLALGLWAQLPTDDLTRHSVGQLLPGDRLLETSEGLGEHVLEHAGSFEEANHGVLEDPRLHVYVNDGRQHLRMQPEGTYDLVTLEPPPLRHAGVASLCSHEFYRLAKSRLKEGGFLTQWLPIFQLPERGEASRSSGRSSAPRARLPTLKTIAESLLCMSLRRDPLTPARPEASRPSVPPR